MHKDVLESERYSEILFRQTALRAQWRLGKVCRKVHGDFSAFTAQITKLWFPPKRTSVRTIGALTRSSRFPTKMGNQNPSNLFLHVSDTVEMTSRRRKRHKA